MDHWSSIELVSLIVSVFGISLSALSSFDFQQLWAPALSKQGLINPLYATIHRAEHGTFTVKDI